jgi:hypothetical protein
MSKKHLNQLKVPPGRRQVKWSRTFAFSSIDLGIVLK